MNFQNFKSVPLKSPPPVLKDLTSKESKGFNLTGLSPISEKPKALLSVKGSQGAGFVSQG